MTTSWGRTGSNTGPRQSQGRKDGESYQIGLVDVVDNPYPETRAAARELGRELYRIRGRTFLPADQDKDGIPDTIELEHGLAPGDPSDAHMDKDKDGKTNLEEYVLGTNISVMDSLMTPDVILMGSQVRVSIPPIFLHEGRRYHIESTNDLHSGWTRLATHMPAGQPTEPFVHEDAHNGRKLYRVRVELVD
jgi:hypothetical protein